jgi:hypothetical protein
VRVRPASRARRNRKRSRRVSKLRRLPRATVGGDTPASTRTAERRAVVDEQRWELEMIRLRRISLLLSVGLAAVIGRIVIDGPKPLGDLAGGLILALLLCSLGLRRQGRRLLPAVSSDTDDVDAR